MTIYKYMLAMIGIVLSGCATIAPPTLTPTRSLTGPTLAPTEPAIPRPPTEFPGSFQDSFGSSDPTAAALPNNLELPPFEIVNPNGRDSVAITLAAETVSGEIYANVPIRAPGVLLIAEDRTLWGAFPQQLEQNNYVVLSIDMPQTAGISEFQTLLSSFSDLSQGDDSRLDAARIAVVGERSAADFVLRGCAVDLRCDAMILLSPTDANGAIATLGQYGTRPVLVTASQDDPISYGLAENIAATAQGEALMQPFISEGSGAVIVQNRPDFAELIISWLNLSVR
jgi:hypothetical protein